MIKRKLFNELKEHLNQKEISLIVGPRQSGKTTLMYMLKEHVEKQGQKTLFLSLDFESDKNFFLSQRALISRIQLEFGSEKGCVFIDEIQRKENAGLFLKGVYDYNLPYKFIVSGSGSLELKEKIHESLIGRKRLFELSTISFDEFVNFKTSYLYENKLHEFFKIEKDKTLELLMEYLNFGGYPRVILEARLEEKKKIIDEIYRSVLEKDLTYLLRLEKLEAFSSLIKVLASQIGRLVNYSELSSTLGISANTVKNYFFYAEKIFIINKVTPFFRSIRKEIIKSPVIYFYDIGLRNFAIGYFGNLTFPFEEGFLFQNFIWNILKDKFRSGSKEIHFWRTKDKAEVDFVINTGRDIIPVEVKFKKLQRPVIERSLSSFISKYKPQKALVINLSLKENLVIDKTEIQFLPFYELIEKGEGET